MTVLRSDQFDDIYFSPDDGLAETQHTFLQGNNLEQRFQDTESFTIVETGFGTGLNFLAALTLFDKIAAKNASLHYVSFEKFPLAKDQIKDVLGPWSSQFSDGALQRLLDLYPIRVSAFHRLVIRENVMLTLVFEDINASIPELEIPQGVDAWFLDGFAPSKNPEMWSETLFNHMKRLSQQNTTAATFTAAGAVKRGLESAGFAVEKVQGFGRKREMITAKFTQDKSLRKAARKPQKIAIIGSGLAGAACAYVLKGRGADLCIFDTADKPASYASGNDLGLFNPRISASKGPEANFFSSGYAALIRTLDGTADQTDFKQCGSLNLIVNEDKDKKFKSAAQNWLWHDDHMQMLTPEQASDIAGIQIEQEALFLQDSGVASPEKLCAYYLDGVPCRFGSDAITLRREQDGWFVNGEIFDVVILANAIGVLDYEYCDWLPLHTVRGQATYFEPTQQTQKIKTNISYGGYISAPYKGQHVIGATFQRWLDHTDTIEEDNDDNLKKLCDALPVLEQDLGSANIAKGWAGLRTSSKDRFAVIGPVPDYQSWKEGSDKYHDGLYVCSALGSHGMVSSIAGAYLLADMICNTPYSLPLPAVEALSPVRFLKRARRKGQF